MLSLRKRCDFSTTRWSVIRDASNSCSERHASALEELCAQYWYPLYAFVRRQGYGEQEAEDLIQEFFARFIERDFLASVGPEKGRFRTFMLVCLKRFLADDLRRRQAIKRGGKRVPTDIELAEQLYGLEAAHQLSPEEHFERRWALSLLENVIAQLVAEMESEGKAELCRHLLPHLVQEDSRVPQSEVAKALNMTPGAVRMETLRLRRRLNSRLRQEIRKTVADPNDVDDEIAQIFRLLGG